MITRLLGSLRSKWTKKKISNLIRGFCLVTSVGFFYETYGLWFLREDVLKKPNHDEQPSIHEREKRKLTLAEYEFIILGRDIFGSSSGAIDAKDNILPLRLVATRPSVFVIMEDARTGKQDLFEKGDSVFDVGEVYFISQYYVEILSNGFKYTFYLSDSLSKDQQKILDIEEGLKENSPEKKEGDSRIIEKSFRNYEVKRGLVKEVLLNLNEHLEGGYSKVYDDGILVYGLGRKSIFRQLGITDSDIITKVNGRPINSFLGALEVFDEMRAEESQTKSVVITVKRAGLEIPIQYTLVD